MDYIIIGLLCFIIGITIAKIIPYIKDKKITPNEKEKIQGIIVDAIKSIIVLSTGITSKEKLIVTITHSIINTIEENNIDGFTEEEIEQMVETIINKLENK